MRFLNHMRKTTLGKVASDLACHTPFYDWTLNAQEVPERLVVKPVDAWRGDAEKGQDICSGRFEYAGGCFSLYGENWNPVGADLKGLEYVHSFIWLRHLRTLGGQMARTQAMELTRSWLRQHERWQALAWRPDIVATRLCMWISHYEILGASLDDEEFQDLFFAALMRQSLHLKRTMVVGAEGIAAFRMAKGMVYAGLALEHREWVNEALIFLTACLDEQILYDGGHVSRAPDKLLSSLQILLDIRLALSAAGAPVPDSVEDAIARMVPAVRFFRYQDKRFALFSGTQKGNADYIDTILAQSGVKGRAIHSLPLSGYEKIVHGRGAVVMEVGSREQASAAPVSPLAFEFCYGKERVFVSCGNHPSCPNWQHALAQISAFNAVSIHDETVTSWHIEMERYEEKHATMIEAQHDGYAPAHGISHSRRIYLAEKGQDLRGEEFLQAALVPLQPLDVAVRFHLHPDVQVSLVQEGAQALLKLRTGSGWRFVHSAGVLSVEDSVFMGEGSMPRKTKQLVIRGNISDREALIKWAMRKEG